LALSFPFFEDLLCSELSSSSLVFLCSLSLSISVCSSLLLFKEELYLLADRDAESMQNKDWILDPKGLVENS
jgi:hypothetical protein